MFDKKKSLSTVILFSAFVIFSSVIHAAVSPDVSKTMVDNELPYGWKTGSNPVNHNTREETIEYVGSCMWSVLTDVFSTGTDVWASFNNGLCHLDISDISNPVVISELYIPCGSKGITGTNDIIVEGDFAYIGDKDGVRIVNINDMELISSYLLQRAHTLFLCDTILYVVDGAGLMVLNVTNPAQPDSIGFYSLPGAVGIDIEANYAYISDTANMGLTILDITVQGDPVFVSNYSTPGYGNNVAFSNGFAFIADHQNGLEIVDVTDPFNPVFTSQIATSGSAHDVEVEGNYVFVASDNMDVIDISNLNSPFIAQSFSTMDNVRSLFLDGNYLFSSETSFLEILNVQVPSNTFLEGSLQRPYWLQEVKVNQDFAYLADMGEIYSLPGGLRIIDISEFENPFLRGEYALDLWAMPNNLDVMDSYVFMQDNIDWTPSFTVIDVNDPDAPQFAGEYPSAAKDIYAENSFGYILDSDVLNILNLQDPLNPSLEGSLTLSGNALRICVDSGYAFIAGDGAFSLWIVDVSNTSSPQLITSITTVCNYARDLVVQENLLYLVCDQHFQIIDITDIDNPEIICTYDDVTGATGICVTGDYLYIAGYDLMKFDISNPEVPFHLESYPIPGCCYNVAVQDNFLFVTTDSAFLIFQDEDLLNTGDISGTVTDINSGNPIEGAVISLGSYSDITEYDGTYLLEDIPVGVYDSLICTAEGYSDSANVVEVIEDQTVTVDFALYPETGADDLIVPVTQLLENYPNPFNPTTTIAFSLAEPGHSTLCVYNIRGRRVATLLDEPLPAGEHSVTWAATGCSSGIYFARLTTPKDVRTTKLALLK
ncbi:MAG: carboxypeptidase regulatory-like domain-containing protein [Candidatus Cloacimonetes bacterium]|nr:carboxypeptidase regulatory-like domain-containing protein [Candidatus Cloacimonadota bacterium]